jgi:hypothetical protein
VGGDNIDRSKQKNCIRTCVLFRSYFTVLYTVHCTDEQNAMSSYELQSALILTVEYSKIYCGVFAENKTVEAEKQPLLSNARMQQ